MEYRPLINYSKPAPKRSSDKALIICWIIVAIALTVALINGLMMRGVL